MSNEAKPYTAEDVSLYDPRAPADSTMARIKATVIERDSIRAAGAAAMALATRATASRLETEAERDALRAEVKRLTASFEEATTFTAKRVTLELEKFGLVGGEKHDATAKERDALREWQVAVTEGSGFVNAASFVRYVKGLETDSNIETVRALREELAEFRAVVDACRDELRIEPRPGGGWSITNVRAGTAEAERDALRATNAELVAALGLATERMEHGHNIIGGFDDAQLVLHFRAALSKAREEER